MDSVNFDSLNITRIELTLANRQTSVLHSAKRSLKHIRYSLYASNKFRACDIYPLNKNEIRKCIFGIDCLRCAAFEIEH